MKNISSEEILEILKNNRELLRKYRVKKIGLFGSHVNYQANSESDIDLIVDFEEKTFDNYIELSFALEKIFKRKIDLLTEKGISPYILPFIHKEVKWYEA